MFLPQTVTNMERMQNSVLPVKNAFNATKGTETCLPRQRSSATRVDITIDLTSITP